MIVEVGGGSTEVLLIDHGDVAFAHTFRLGSLRLRKTLEAFHAPVGKVRAIMESQIARIVDQVRKHVPADHSLIMIALGGDIRFATAELLPSWDGHSLATVPVAELRKLTEKTVAQSVDEILHKFHLAVPDAEALGPALLTYVRLARALLLEEILVSPLNLRDGLIKEMASRDEWTENFTHQIIRSALDFGRRFGFDEPHGRHVAELSRMLFRALQPEHQLGYRYEVTLYVAALLHDVGYAVSARSHHKHSMYLIGNGDSVRAESEGRVAGGADGPLPSPVVAQTDPRGLRDLGLGEPHQCGQDGRHAAAGRLRWIAPTVSESRTFSARVKTTVGSFPSRGRTTCRSNNSPCSRSRPCSKKSSACRCWSATRRTCWGPREATSRKD